MCDWESYPAAPVDTEVVKDSSGCNCYYLSAVRWLLSPPRSTYRTQEDEHYAKKGIRRRITIKPLYTVCPWPSVVLWWSPSTLNLVVMQWWVRSWYHRQWTTGARGKKLSRDSRKCHSSELWWLGLNCSFIITKAGSCDSKGERQSRWYYNWI